MNKIIKRYGVHTSSGSWYLIEDHTHLFGKPVWKIITEKGEFYIAGLMKHKENPINVGDIKNIRQFIGYQIYFDKEKREFPLVEIYHTSTVEETIEFK